MPNGWYLTSNIRYQFQKNDIGQFLVQSAQNVKIIHGGRSFSQQKAYYVST